MDVKWIISLFKPACKVWWRFRIYLKEALHLFEINPIRKQKNECQVEATNISFSIYCILWQKNWQKYLLWKYFWSVFFHIDWSWRGSNFNENSIKSTSMSAQQRPHSWRNIKNEIWWHEERHIFALYFIQKNIILYQKPNHIDQSVVRPLIL